MGLTKLQSRTLLRNMVKMQIIATYMNDVGRQRITKYVSKKFEKQSKMSKQFKKEMHKIKTLTKQIASENEEKLKQKAVAQTENETPAVQYEDIRTNKTSQSNDDEIDVEASVVVEDKNENKSENKDQDKNKNGTGEKREFKNSFYAVNRILYKYQILKSLPKYKYTSSRSLLLKSKSPDTKQQESKSKALSTSLRQIATDAKTTSLYNSIKMNLIAQKLPRSEKEDNEAFGFMNAVQNSETSNSSNITYRYCLKMDSLLNDYL